MYTLLIAEDERDLREAILRSVDWKSAGFEVVEAADTDAAIAAPAERYGCACACGIVLAAHHRDAVRVLFG